MATVLSRLREDLDILPSPVPDRPGLLVRDPFRYAEGAIIIPPLLARCLTCFDGAQTDLDLRAVLTRLTGRIDLSEAADGLARALSEGGYLNDSTFHALRAQRHQAFAQSPVRDPAFAGGGYPEDGTALSQTVRSWIGADQAQAPVGGNPPGATPAAATGRVVGIAAPHVSPTGGVSTYGAAYRALVPTLAERTFVILGTSHYGHPNRFGVTRKNFLTPLGEARTNIDLVDRFAGAAPDAVDVEDYCHAVEHSIEFQVLFLQSLFGSEVRILPILCGPFVTPGVARPEVDSGVARAIDALGELQAARGDHLAWVLAVDMAHMGRRYGDKWNAHAHEGEMEEVSRRDRARLERITSADPGGFWDLVRERGHDDLKWCGSSPFYTFLRAHPGTRGEVLHYDHWNIDEQSVVSFAAISFSQANVSPSYPQR